MAKALDRRNLNNLRPTASTTRVLDLALVAERYGETPEFLEAPFFRNAPLNKCLILKHALRRNEQEIFRGMRLIATKVLFPYASADLSLGGEYLFFGEPDFAKKLQTRLGVKNDADFQQDLELLTVIDELPSFDPFLMRERLRQIGRAPARCYFEVSVADTERMQAFVTAQIAQLVALAFKGAGPSANEMASRMANKLMTDETAQTLEPLRQTLRMSGDEYREGVFAWKGFLYYKWSIQEWGSKLPDLGRSILSARIINAPREDLQTINLSRQLIVKLMGSTMRRVNAALEKYDFAFHALQNGKPTAFRDFLIEAPSMFLDIGEAVGVIKHLESFWRFRFPAGRTPLMESAEALDIFQDFELTVSGINPTTDAAVMTVA